MSNGVALCRICLASNIKMHLIADTPYQEIFEKLATEVCTSDGRPETVCWVCLAALRRGRRLADTARATHQILTQLSLNGIQLSEDTLTMLDKKFVYKLAWTPIESISISEKNNHVPFKVEPPVNEEIISGDEKINGNISDDERIKSNISEDEPFTIKNEQITCDSRTICVNKVHIGNTSKNELCTRNISRNHQITGDKCKKESLISKVRRQANDYTLKREKSSREKNQAYAKKRSNTKSTEVTVKDEKGQDCVRHKCEHCDKTYKQRSHLLRHLKTHTKIASIPSLDQSAHLPLKVVLCEKCGKGFLNNWTLKKHILSHHMDVRNFCCDHCPIKFVTKSDLIRHMRIHTGQKPYKCDICGRRYTQKAMLERHIRIHTGEQPYSCDRCSLKFNRLSSLVRHMKRRHFTSGERCYNYKGNCRP